MSRRRRTVLLAAAVLLAAVVGFVALLWFTQRSLIYQPDTTQVGSVTEFEANARDITLDTEDGLELDAWLLEPDAEADREAAVLYAPGNGGNRQARLGIGNELTDRGFTVLLMDYRGYGGNPGSPSEEGLAMDAVAAVEALGQEGFPPERTLYLGESRGTAVVAALQATHPPAGVLLRSPYTEFAAIADAYLPLLPARLILRDEFPVSDYMQDSDVPVTVFHGTADTIVPSELSAEVADTAGNLHEEIVLEGVDHNDPEMFGAPVADALEDLADAVLAPVHQ